MKAKDCVQDAAIRHVATSGGKVGEKRLSADRAIIFISQLCNYIASPRPESIAKPALTVFEDEDVYSLQPRLP